MKIIRRTLSLIIVVASGFAGAPAEAQSLPPVIYTSVPSEAFVQGHGFATSDCQPYRTLFGLHFTSSGGNCWANAAVNLPVGYRPTRLECRVSAAATDASPDMVQIRLKKREDGTDTSITVLDSAGSAFGPGARWITASLNQPRRVAAHEPWFITIFFPMAGVASTDAEVKVEYCRVLSVAN